MKTAKNYLFRITMLMSIGTLFFAFSTNPTTDPVQTKTVRFEKGQVIDILSVIKKPGTDDALNEYFQKVFPSATMNGFKIDAQFVPIGPPTQGNYHPDFYSLMSWTKEDSRNNFLAAAKELPYDYLSARKNIWSVFNLTQYEALEEPLEFEVRSDKIYVVTNYWIDNMDAFNSARKKSSSSMKKAGGTLKLVLGKGESPAEYTYEPNIVSITEWDNAEAFDQYLASKKANQSAGIKSVNQWKTKFIFPKTK